MDWFIEYKWLHIFGVCGMVGTTLCNGLLHRYALVAKSSDERRVVLNLVMHLNRLVMAPSFFLLIISGGLMTYHLKISTYPLWLSLSMVMTAVLVIAFIIGYVLEHKLLELAIKSEPDIKYQRLFWQTAPVGISATILSAIVIYLMISKVG